MFNKLIKRFKYWVKYTFDKDTIKYRGQLIKSAKRYKPWDYAFILDILENIGKWNEVYYDKHGDFVGAPLVVRDMKLLQNLSKILKEESSLYECGESSEGRRIRLGVNTKNYKRFITGVDEDFVIRFPEELYICKAQNLLGKLISYRITRWWN